VDRRTGIGRRGLLALTAGVLGTQLSACARPGRATGLHASLTISSGDPGGVYHAWAEALRHLAARRSRHLDLSVIPSAGSVQNVERLGRHDADLALTTQDSAVLAQTGSDPFDAAVHPAALARVHDDYLHLLVRSDSPVRSLQDLAGRRTSVGPPRSGTALVARRVLGRARVTVRELPLDLGQSCDALRAGRLEGFFWSGGLPTPAVVELSRDLPLRAVALDQVVEGLRADHGGIYRPALLPAGAYGLREPVGTLVCPNLLVCSPDTAENTVTAILEMMFEGRDELASAVPAANALDLRAAALTAPVGLHPGALKYYRSTKP
jgi:uncharacterized protein